jgi:hypothetical protein
MNWNKAGFDNRKFKRAVDDLERDPNDFREKYNETELKHRFGRRKAPRTRFVRRVILFCNIAIGATIGWILWLAYKFLIEKGII